ncbi:hypothetical protein CY34DRAFT_18719 [Suillus luteus UH-Slu-Lm8-n1]|uniref:Unplaced genomic scaffold CY34scaffold_947, whole genome shotgun sequence n=1 Tax=Suillus luteus UH-Slu-Lm8-n1 TaxID=930992 RepID=A0A0D0ALX2_9AGAM|nr:hypothetical protein CY34DRAFT_18719 [Suillus luteus UH-Slu-Lm8-n1]
MRRHESEIRAEALRIQGNAAISFFDGVQNCDPPPPQRRRRSFAPPWGSRLRALLARLPQLFSGSQPNADEPTELQQRPGPSTSSRPRPPVVEVPALDDKKALYVARRPETASEIAQRIKNPKWWVRIVLFICCVSPSTNDGPVADGTQHPPST